MRARELFLTYSRVPNEVTRQVMLDHLIHTLGRYGGLKYFIAE